MVFRIGEFGESPLGSATAANIRADMHDLLAKPRFAMGNELTSELEQIASLN